MKPIISYMTVFCFHRGHMFAFTTYESMPSRDKKILREAAQPNINIAVYALTLGYTSIFRNQ